MPKTKPRIGPPSIREYLAGERFDGTPIRDRDKCNAHRSHRGLDPLPPFPTQATVPRITPDGKQNLPKPCCKGWPGTELKAILKSLGLSAEWCIGCQGKAVQMDRWGVAGCRERRELIRGWMIDGMKSATWWETSRAAVLAVSHGMLVDPLDPAGWLVDEAIRRAEAKQQECCNAD